MAVNVPINFIANVDAAAQQFNKLSSVIKTTAVVAAAAFVASKLADYVGEITKAAAGAEESTHKLGMSLKLTGDYSKQNVKAFEDLAEQLQRTAGYDDDLVKSQIIVAKQFGATNEEAAKLVLAAADLAAATGTDLPAATQLLGRSLDGTAGKLNELIPGMRSLNAEQLTAGGAIDLVAKRFKGFAEGGLETYNGMLKQISLAYDDIGKTLGKAIVENEAVRLSMKAVVDVFNIFKDVAGSSTSAISNFITSGIKIFVLGLGTALEITYKFSEAILILARDVSDFFRTIGSIPAVIAKLTTLDFSGAKKIQADLQKAYADDDMAGKKMLDRQGEIIGRVAKLSYEIGKVEQNQSAVTKEVDKTAKGFDNQKTNVQKINKELLAQFKALEEGAQKSGATQLEALTKQFNKEMKLLDDALKQKIASEKEVNAVRSALAEKFYAEQKKLRQEELKDLVSNPFKGVFSDDTFFTRLASGVQNAMARGVGSAQLILQGAAGAKKMLGSILEQVTGIPGVGALFEALAAGPEQVRAMVTEFANAIPDIIAAVLDSIPVLVETLAENLDEIIIRLVDKLGERAPDIAIAISKAMAITLPVAIAKAVAGLISGAAAVVEKWIRGAIEFAAKTVEGAGQFVGKILEGAVQFIGKILEGAGQFVQRLVDEIGKGIGNIGGGIAGAIGGGGGGGVGGVIGGIVGGIGGAIGSIGGGFGFAKGGIVPEGFPNDNYPASLTSGEMIVPTDDVAKLRAFLNSQTSGAGQSQNLTVNISVGEDQLAKVLLNLNRRGFRTA